MTKTIEVEVFGHRFSLQGEGDEAYFHELAEYVDTQMRTLAKQTKTSTPTKRLPPVWDRGTGHFFDVA